MPKLVEPPWSPEYVDHLAKELEEAADCVWAGPAVDGDLLLIDHLRAYAGQLRTMNDMTFFSASAAMN